MSLLISESHASPSSALFSPVLSGKFPVIAGTTQTIAIPGMTANGLVMLMYIHTNATGGAGQFFSNVVPGVNQVVVTLGQAGASTPNQEYIVWSVLKF